jgi:hypothetical protein
MELAGVSPLARLVDRGKARLGGDRWGKTGKDRREWRKSGLEAMALP